MTLDQIARKYRLSLIYVFGSQVETALASLQGQSPPVTDPLSDIDIGVVFEDGLPPAVLSRRNIYRRDEETRFRYEEDVARRAADFRPVLERFYDEILEEI